MPRSSVLLCLPLTALACQSPEANVHNLRVLHAENGTAQHQGDLHGPFEHVLGELMSSSTVGKPEFMKRQGQEEIDNPYEECLDNLSELLSADLDDPRVFGDAVEIVTWLIGDCTYVLSRERCARALLPLGKRAGLRAPGRADPERAAATPDEVAEAVAVLLRGAKDRLEVDRSGIRTGSLVEASAPLLDLELDRDGARRALAFATLLVGRGGEVGDDTPALDLQRELARRSLERALEAALADPADRVRAAAVRAWIRLTAGREAAAFEVALGDSGPEVALVSLRALAEYGAPIPAGATPEQARAAEQLWMSRVMSLVGGFVEGPLQVAACRAMARLSGEPENLHPEHWVEYWEERRAAAEPSATEG